MFDCEEKRKIIYNFRPNREQFGKCNYCIAYRPSGHRIRSYSHRIDTRPEVRWPTSVTAKVNSHGKIKLTHGKIKLTHGKIKLTHSKIKLTHGKIELTHGKIKLTRGKINLTK